MKISDMSELYLGVAKMIHCTTNPRPTLQHMEHIDFFKYGK